MQCLLEQSFISEISGGFVYLFGLSGRIGFKRREALISQEKINVPLVERKVVYNAGLSPATPHHCCMFCGWGMQERFDALEFQFFSQYV